MGSSPTNLKNNGHLLCISKAVFWFFLQHQIVRLDHLRALIAADHGHVLWMFEDPVNIRLLNNAIFYREIMSENEMNGVVTPTDVQNARPLDDYRATEEFTTYEQLCRGEIPLVSRYWFLSWIACCCVTALTSVLWSCWLSNRKAKFPCWTRPNLE